MLNLLGVMEVIKIHVVQESFHLIIYNGIGFHRMFRNWAILPRLEHTTLSYLVHQISHDSRVFVTEMYI